MILVTVGTSRFPFDRLLRAVEALEPAEPLVVQHGPSSIQPANAVCSPFLEMDELTRLIREARIVVTHAGVGSILLSLANGKRPIVVPRRRLFDETVDDHQVESARRFAKAGLVTLVEEPQRLAAAIAGPRQEAEPAIGPNGGLVGELREYIAVVMGRPEGAPA